LAVVDWHLYDYYLVPGGGYFGTKKAMEPLHVQYDYADRSVAVVNDTYEAHPGVKVVAKVYNLEGKELASHEEKIDCAARCERESVRFCRRRWIDHDVFHEAADVDARENS